MGNLIPAVFWLPPLAIGLTLMLVDAEVSTLGIGLLVASTVLGWLAVNAFGLYQNRAMQLETRSLLKGRANIPANAPFVGYASPRYTSLLDAHEDVGYLLSLPDRLVFQSQMRRVEITRSQLRRIGFRPNVHTLLLLGRWISIEGLADGRPIRMLIEPRMRGTLLGNFRRSRELRDRLRAWHKEAGPDDVGAA